MACGSCSATSTLCPSQAGLELSLCSRGLVTAGRLEGGENSLQKEFLLHRTFNIFLTIDHRLRNCINSVSARDIRELGGLNGVGRDEFAFHRKAVGQADRLGAVRSGRRDEDLKVQRLSDAAELFLAFLL